jgi:hypothetical protein
MNEAQRVVNEASSESMKHLDYRGRKWLKIEHNTVWPEKVVKWVKKRVTGDTSF